MKFNELTAEQLMQSLALIGEAAEHVMQGGIGKDLVKEIAAYRSKPKAKGTKQADAFEWAAGLVSKCIPRMLKENVGDLYKVLAAVDGLTVEEYEACSNAAKVVSDVAALKAALAEDGELRQLFAGFLA